MQNIMSHVTPRSTARTTTSVSRVFGSDVMLAAAVLWVQDRFLQPPAKPCFKTCECDRAVRTYEHSSDHSRHEGQKKKNNTRFLFTATMRKVETSGTSRSDLVGHCSPQTQTTR